MNPTPALKQAIRLIEFLLLSPNDQNVRDLARDFVETMKSLELPPPRSFTVASPRTAGAPPASPGPDFPEDASERLQGPAKPPGNLVGEHDKRGMTPYGFRWVKVNGYRDHLEKDEHEQRVLAKITDLRTAGHSYRQIVNKLNCLGKDYAPRGARLWTIGGLRLRLEQLQGEGVLPPASS